jgi:hypothetical protein
VYGPANWDATAPAGVPEPSGGTADIGWYSQPQIQHQQGPDPRDPVISRKDRNGLYIAFDPSLVIRPEDLAGAIEAINGPQAADSTSLTIELNPDIANAPWVPETLRQAGFEIVPRLSADSSGLLYEVATPGQILAAKQTWFVDGGASGAQLMMRSPDGTFSQVDVEALIGESLGSGEEGLVYAFADGIQPSQWVIKILRTEQSTPGSTGPVTIPLDQISRNANNERDILDFYWGAGAKTIRAIGPIGARGSLALIMPRKAPGSMAPRGVDPMLLAEQEGRITPRTVMDLHRLGQVFENIGRYPADFQFLLGAAGEVWLNDPKLGRDSNFASIAHEWIWNARRVIANSPDWTGNNHGSVRFFVVRADAAPSRAHVRPAIPRVTYDTVAKAKSAAIPDPGNDSRNYPGGYLYAYYLYDPAHGSRIIGRRPVDAQGFFTGPFESARRPGGFTVIDRTPPWERQSDSGTSEIGWQAQPPQQNQQGPATPSAGGTAPEPEIHVYAPGAFGNAGGMPLDGTRSHILNVFPENLESFANSLPGAPFSGQFAQVRFMFQWDTSDDAPIEENRANSDLALKALDAAHAYLQPGTGSVHWHWGARHENASDLLEGRFAETGYTGISAEPVLDSATAEITGFNVTGCEPDWSVYQAGGPRTNTNHIFGSDMVSPAEETAQEMLPSGEPVADWPQHTTTLLVVAGDGVAFLNHIPAPSEAKYDWVIMTASHFDDPLTDLMTGRALDYLKPGGRIRVISSDSSPGDLMTHIGLYPGLPTIRYNRDDGTGQILSKQAEAVTDPQPQSAYSHNDYFGSSYLSPEEIAFDMRPNTPRAVWPVYPAVLRLGLDNLPSVEDFFHRSPEQRYDGVRIVTDSNLESKQPPTGVGNLGRDALTFFFARAGAYLWDHGVLRFEMPAASVTAGRQAEIQSAFQLAGFEVPDRYSDPNDSDRLIFEAGILPGQRPVSADAGSWQPPGPEDGMVPPDNAAAPGVEEASAASPDPLSQESPYGTGWVSGSPPDARVTLHLFDSRGITMGSNARPDSEQVPEPPGWPTDRYMLAMDGNLVPAFTASTPEIPFFYNEVRVTHNEFLGPSAGQEITPDFIATARLYADPSAGRLSVRGIEGEEAARIARLFQEAGLQPVILQSLEAQASGRAPRYQIIGYLSSLAMPAYSNVSPEVHLYTAPPSRSSETTPLDPARPHVLEVPGYLLASFAASLPGTGFQGQFAQVRLTPPETSGPDAGSHDPLLVHMALDAAHAYLQPGGSVHLRGVPAEISIALRPAFRSLGYVRTFPELVLDVAGEPAAFDVVGHEPDWSAGAGGEPRTHTSYLGGLDIGFPEDTPRGMLPFGEPPAGWPRQTTSVEVPDVIDFLNQTPAERYNLVTVGYDRLGSDSGLDQTVMAHAVNYYLAENGRLRLTTSRILRMQDLPALRQVFGGGMIQYNRDPRTGQITGTTYEVAQSRPA